MHRSYFLGGEVYLCVGWLFFSGHGRSVSRSAVAGAVVGLGRLCWGRCWPGRILLDRVVCRFCLVWAFSPQCPCCSLRWQKASSFLFWRAMCLWHATHFCVFTPSAALMRAFERCPLLCRSLRWWKAFSLLAIGLSWRAIGAWRARHFCVVTSSVALKRFFERCPRLCHSRRWWKVSSHLAMGLSRQAIGAWRVRHFCVVTSSVASTRVFEHCPPLEMALSRRVKYCLGSLPHCSSVVEVDDGVGGLVPVPLGSLLVSL